MNTRRTRFEATFGRQDSSVVSHVIKNAPIAAWTFAEQIEEPPKKKTPPTPET